MFFGNTLSFSMIPSMIFQELNDLAEHPEAQRRERLTPEKEDDGCGGGAERSRCTSIIV